MNVPGNEVLQVLQHYLAIAAHPTARLVVEQFAGLLVDAMRKAQQELAEPVVPSVLPAWGVVELDDRSEVAGRLVREPGFHGKMLRVEVARSADLGPEVILVGVPTIRRIVILPESAVRAAASDDGPLPRNPLPVPVSHQADGLVFPDLDLCPKDELDDEGEDELPQSEDDQG